MIQLKIFSILCLFFIGTASFAVTLSFPQCPMDKVGKSIDHFCPRLEGVHLPNCCPVGALNSTLSCKYHVERTEPQLRDGTRRICDRTTVPPTETSVQCCEFHHPACITDLKTVLFRPRLVMNSGQCCSEQCPGADWWRSGPVSDTATLTAAHKRSGSGDPVTCSQIQPSICKYGVSCPADDPCPIPTTGSGGTGSGGGGTPGADPAGPGNPPSPVPGITPADSNDY